MGRAAVDVGVVIDAPRTTGTYTLSRQGALPVSDGHRSRMVLQFARARFATWIVYGKSSGFGAMPRAKSDQQKRLGEAGSRVVRDIVTRSHRSEEHTSELQSRA